MKKTKKKKSPEHERKPTYLHTYMSIHTYLHIKLLYVAMGCVRREPGLVRWDLQDTKKTPHFSAALTYPNARFRDILAASAYTEYLETAIKLYSCIHSMPSFHIHNLKIQTKNRQARLLHAYPWISPPIMFRYVDAM